MANCLVTTSRVQYTYIMTFRSRNMTWKNMKKKKKKKKLTTNKQYLVVRWPHISSIITFSSNSQTTQQPSAVGNNSKNRNSIFHFFGMWRGGGVYCRLTSQWSYLHRWFLKSIFLQIHFSYCFVFFFYYLALQKYLTPWFKFVFSLAASAPYTPITSSGDNFKYRGPQLVFSIYFYYWFLWSSR